MEGNLLSGARLVDVEITDSAGAPFLAADTVAFHYDLHSLVSSRLYFHDVRMVRPVVHLTQPPGGGPWNYQRIFPGSAKTRADTVPGLGSWIRIRSMRVVHGKLIMRSAWSPADSLTDGPRQAAIADALSWDSRPWIVRVDGGFQQIREALRIDGVFPLLQLADPDSAARIVQVDSLSTVAFPFRPPAADVRQFAGRLVLTQDSLRIHQARLVLPGSRVTLEGSYALNSAGASAGWANVDASQLTLGDLRFARPTLPSGGGALQARASHEDGDTHIALSGMDLHAEGATVRGSADLHLGNGFRLGPSDLRIQDLDTRVAQDLAPGASLPLSGVLDADVKLSGEASAMSVDGTVAFTDRSGATSQVVADGRMGFQNGFRAQGLRLRLEPLQTSLARTFRPGLPLKGTVTGTTTLTGTSDTGFDVQANLVGHDPVAGRSHVLANGRLALGGAPAARGLTVRLEPLQTELARVIVPQLPLKGTITGRATVTGSPSTGFALDADLVSHDPEAGTSHLLADGRIALGAHPEAKDLHLRFEPLQVALADRVMSGSLPVEGTLTGTATLNGWPTTRLSAHLDVTHHAPTGLTHAVGTATLAGLGGGGATRMNVDLQLPAVSLTTVGRVAPSTGLHGEGHGHVALQGTTRDLALNADLAVQGGGEVHARGTLVRTGARPRYDLTARLASFDPSAFSTRGPDATLSGTVTANGTGTALATADATVTAHLRDLRVDTTHVDTTAVALRLSDGLLTVNQGHVAMGSATAELQGSFGLTADRQGVLTYRLAVDSLSHFSGLVPAGNGAAPPRPVQQARVVARARADSLRVADSTEVSRMATGEPPPPTLRYDTLAALPRDSVSGSLRARGTMTGNLHAFDVSGSATADHLVAMGNAVGHADVTYTVRGIGQPTAAYQLAANLDSVSAQGFQADSATLEGSYTGVRGRGTGTLDVSAFQDQQRDYHVGADFRLAQDQQELTLNRLAMRFDTTRWTSTQPGRVSWSGEGIDVHGIDLVSNEGGRLALEGQLPVQAPADLRLDADSVHLANVAALLQDTAQARGLLSFHGTIQGTRDAPTMQGSATLLDGAWGARSLPDVQATFQYADTHLTARAVLTQDTLQVLTAQADLPIDLSLGGVQGSRLLDRPLEVVTHADSLPLEALPSVSPQIADLRGVLNGDVAVRGTWHDPLLSGAVTLRRSSARIPAAGITLNGIAASLQLAGDSAWVDSLVAHSARGTIQVEGAVALQSLTAPTFDLTLHTDNALLLDNERGRVNASANLALTGSLQAPKVTGEVNVMSGVLYVPSLQGRRVTDLTDPALLQGLDTTEVAAGVLPNPNPLLSRVTADVSVRVSRDTWVRNTNGNAEVYTPAGGRRST